MSERSRWRESEPIPSLGVEEGCFFGGSAREVPLSSEATSAMNFSAALGSLKKSETSLIGMSEKFTFLLLTSSYAHKLFYSRPLYSLGKGVSIYKSQGLEEDML